MNLKDFLIQPKNFTSERIVESFERCSNIEELTVIDTDGLIQFSENGFQHIYRLQRLRTLALHSFPAIDDNILAEMRNRFSELTHIDITGMELSNSFHASPFLFSRLPLRHRRRFENNSDNTQSAHSNHHQIDQNPRFWFIIGNIVTTFGM